MQVIDREQFAAGQKAMTTNWCNNLRQRGIDVDAYILTREDAYLDRWREAARFMANGARVLDIGGGHGFPRLYEFFRSRQFDYFYLDIGAGEVGRAKELAVAMGFDPGHMNQGFNDDLPFADGFFDAIFSSHCIEHSFDLLKTMRELNRVLKVGGVLTMAVPLGWEINPAHPYFFGVSEWLALVVDAGFELRVWQMGKEYPEDGYDLFIAARKRAPASRDFRIDPDLYRKDRLIFLPFSDSRFAYSGKFARKDELIIMLGEDWTIAFDVESDTTEILPIFSRHDWSAIVSISCGETGDATVEDLFSVQTWTHPARLALSRARSGPGMVAIRPVGRNPASFSTEGVFVGALLRRAG